MKTRRITGYPIVFNVARTAAPGLEEIVAPTVLDRSLAEGVDIELRLNHDPSKVLARTGDGSLKLSVTSAVGVHVDAQFDPTTEAGAEVAAALDAGTITGGSFGFHPLRSRWEVSGDPIRCTLRDAIVSEVSIALAPRRAAFAGTWAGELRGQLAELFAKTESDRKRFGIRAAAPESDTRKADLVVTVPRPSLAESIAAPLVRLFEDSVTTEWGLVRKAAEQNPSAKLIDLYHPRSLGELQNVLKRRAVRLGVPHRGAAWDIQTVADRIEKKRSEAPRASSTTATQRSPNTMTDDFEAMPLERRPAPGSSIAKAEHFAGARSSFKNFMAAVHAAGGRPPVGANGRPQSWAEGRGWFDDTSERRTSARGLRVSELEKQVRQRAARHAADVEACNPRAIGPKLRRMAEQAEHINAQGRVR